MSIIKEMVRNILFYYIVVSIIMSLAGNSSYKKYIKLFTGLVLILIILMPVLKLLKLNDKMEFNLSKNQLYEMTQQESDGITAAELAQSDILEKEYETAIKKQVQDDLESNSLYPEQLEIEIEDSLDSGEFGQIKSVKAVCSQQNQNQTEENTDSIAAIEISKIEIDESNKVDNTDNVYQAKEVAEKLAEKYDLPEEQIDIEVKEEQQNEG